MTFKHASLFREALVLFTNFLLHLSTSFLLPHNLCYLFLVTKKRKVFKERCIDIYNDAC